MSPSLALHDPIFRIYLLLVSGALILAAAAILLAQRVLHKDLRSVWLTYKGWLIMVPVVVVAVFLGRWAIILGTTVLSILGFKEFARATGLYRDWWMTGAVYITILAIGFVTWMHDPFNGRPGWFGLFMALPVFAISFLLMIPILLDRTKGQLQAMSLSILGFIYLGWMFGHLGFLANTSHAYGYLLYIIFATELNDIVAFTSGKLFGHRILRSNVSPKKTWGGAIGAVAVSMALPWALRFSFPHFTTAELILTGVIVGVGGQFGDLCISVIKRDIGVKDMGATIPGHGGILDRIDSLIFVAPLFLHTVNYFTGI